MRRIAFLVVLVGIAAGAWLFRAELMGLWQSLRSEPPATVASPELAESAERKLATMGEADAPARVTLTSAELQSLVAYRMAQSLPGFILAPQVTVDEGRLLVHARVPTEEVSDVRGLGGAEELLAMLPDTTEVQASGHLIPLGDGRVGLAIDEVSAASIPLPKRYIPRLLDRVGRVDEPGLPNEALAVRLPTGAQNAYAHGDSIVFVTRTAATPSE